MSQEQTDFVVVGAGSAGCVVAGRLSDAGYNVVLLEAGGKDSNPWIHIPLGYAKLYANPNVNWCYTSEPEPNMHNRRLHQPRGKVLGGTGSINGMIYVRGQPEDFNRWETEGCEGWGFDSVLPFFKKSEHQERGADAFHGINGPVWVSDLPSTHPIADAFNQASVNLGAPENPDFNGKSQLGTGYVQVNTKDARRWSTAAAYLRSNLGRNIDIRTHVTVQRILLDNGKATGVEYRDKRGVTNTVTPSKEVIVCGGTFNSPQLLELSGIGDSKHLESVGITPTHHLPGVGNNLQDHFGIGLEYKSTQPLTVNDLANNPLKGALAMAQYILFRTGPMASNGNYSNTFISTTGDDEHPDMMITFMAWCTGEDLQPRKFSGFTILPEHIRPESRGFVHTKSANPGDAPAIQFNFLSTQYDREAAIAGLRHARKIAATQPMKQFVDSEINPGPDYESDEQLLEHCRESGLSLLHPVGTCKMGIDDMAVVDPRLRVHGVENLRVIDASIMPTIVSGNTNAATMMIGEKGAAMVLEDWASIPMQAAGR